MTAVLIMAGGTGGHVYPALAVAAALRQDSHYVSWVGTRTGLESQVVPAADIAIDWIKVSGLRGHGLFSWLLAPFRLVAALFQALQIVYRRKPGVVLGMGGFVAGPGGVAAWLLRRPLVIHEQNAVAGLTNRLLAPLATEVLQAFPGAFADKIAAQTVGNPVRDSIVQLAAPRDRMLTRSGPVRLLVLGGSQGALALNENVPAALAAMDAIVRPEVWHQAGARTYNLAERAYAEHRMEARIEPFIDDMAAAYAWADLVVCRAGALTVAELAAAGVAAIFVPYPLSIDDHQTLNAGYLVDAGAARLIPQAQLDATRLARELETLCGDRARLLKMAENARSASVSNATSAVRDKCLQAAAGVRHD
ncbi:MAG: undecaprenyldiphospho-muramoylpentapeptide beta-N-acetylglucosaminyltransferase [Gammaproteobacteria bacterium]|nr:undecaprenyldiphospho-muramoylpentapeptide beta-N-acetylglucosaminyltransferase [Gammaproteobacteria bacterium]